MPNPTKSLSLDQLRDALKADFPDLTTSKIRFLEDQQFLFTERATAGDPVFGDDDLEVLRFILTAQRDEYLPLKIIRKRLQVRWPDAARRSRWPVFTRAGRELILLKLSAAVAPAPTDAVNERWVSTLEGTPAELAIPIYRTPQQGEALRLPHITVTALLSSEPLGHDSTGKRSMARVAWTQDDFTLDEHVFAAVIADIPWESVARDVSL